MNLSNKKYFSISEVCEITGFPAHKLRYLEKSKTGIGIFQIRGRRYYTSEDIELIKQKLGKESEFQLNLFSPKMEETSKKGHYNLILQSTMITRIDSLISKFTKLEQTIDSIYHSSSI